MVELSPNWIHNIGTSQMVVMKGYADGQLLQGLGDRWHFQVVDKPNILIPCLVVENVKRKRYELDIADAIKNDAAV